MRTVMLTVTGLTAQGKAILNIKKYFQNELRIILKLGGMAGIATYEGDLARIYAVARAGAVGEYRGTNRV